MSLSVSWAKAIEEKKTLFPSERTDPLAGKVIDNRYRLIRRAGAGGMSVIYLAERVGLDKPIAIKFLRSAFASLPDFVMRFEQEARACSRLDHQHCLSVIDFGIGLGCPFIVMEYLDGKPLTDALACGPIPSLRGIHITRQILAGLQHAHSRGVVHRDLKPANIMLLSSTGSEDFVKILDFGTAQLMGGNPTDARLDQTEVGTPWYLSPEQAQGQPTDHRTDLYGVGVILFEMLTGERPYVAEDPFRVVEMHIKSPVPSARALKPHLGLSRELEAVIFCAMQKQPEARYASAEEFDQALMAVPELRPREPLKRVPSVKPISSEPKLEGRMQHSQKKGPSKLHASSIAGKKKRSTKKKLQQRFSKAALLTAVIAMALLALTVVTLVIFH